MAMPMRTSSFWSRLSSMSPLSATLPSASQLATIQWGSTSAGAKSGRVPTVQPSRRSTESFLAASSSPRTSSGPSLPQTRLAAACERPGGAGGGAPSAWPRVHGGRYSSTSSRWRNASERSAAASRNGRLASGPLSSAATFGSGRVGSASRRSWSSVSCCATCRAAMPTSSLGSSAARSAAGTRAKAISTYTSAKLETIGWSVERKSLARPPSGSRTDASPLTRLLMWPRMAITLLRTAGSADERKPRMLGSAISSSLASLVSSQRPMRSSAASSFSKSGLLSAMGELVGGSYTCGSWVVRGSSTHG